MRTLGPNGPPRSETFVFHGAEVRLQVDPYALNGLSKLRPAALVGRHLAKNVRFYDKSDISKLDPRHLWRPQAPAAFPSKTRHTGGLSSALQAQTLDASGVLTAF